MQLPGPDNAKLRSASLEDKFAFRCVSPVAALHNWCAVSASSICNEAACAASTVLHNIVQG